MSAENTVVPATDVSTQATYDAVFRAIVASDAKHDARFARVVLDEEEIELPRELIAVLRQTVEAMRAGRAVSIVPVDMKLTTQEAADHLGVSRPTLVRLLESGKIPFEKINSHRRVYLQDLLTYQERQRRLAHEALSDMVADAQMSGDYEFTREEVDEALRHARKGAH